MGGLSRSEVDALDWDVWVALLGKSVARPGGLRGTRQHLSWGEFARSQHVLDAGSGTGATATLLARRFGVEVTAVDISPAVVAAARRRADAAGLCSPSIASVLARGGFR